MKPKITILLQANSQAPYGLAGMQKTLDSLEKQVESNHEVLLYGDWKEAEKEAMKRGHRFVTANLSTPSQALNAAFAAADGDYLLICDTARNAIEFKSAATLFYRLVMERHPDAVMLYSDYDLIDAGKHLERKLLEFHPGRLMDSWDMGYCLLFARTFLNAVGFCDEKIRFHPLYDLRLKAFETQRIVHVSNRFNGVPYVVYAAAKGQDVFAYLKAGKAVAQELEAICTEHLKRIHAYLAPGQNYHSVVYTGEEEKSFQACLASVVIPVFNRPEFICSAIESVQAQTVSNVECVVVCNGGESDPTVEQVRRYMPGGDRYRADKPAVRAIVLDINNLGLCFNAALQTSKAKYYVQLDSDDLLFEDAVEKILAVYEQDDRIGMVIGSYQVYEKKSGGSVVPVLVDGKPFIVTHDEWTEENGRNNLLRINGAGAPRSIKLKVLKEVGWFGMNDSPYCRNYGEDYELVNKVAERYRIGRVWDPIYKVVRHSGGTDHQIDQVTIDVNDNAKDHMRLEAIKRRQAINLND